MRRGHRDTLGRGVSSCRKKGGLLHRRGKGEDANNLYLEGKRKGLWNPGEGGRGFNREEKKKSKQGTLADSRKNAIQYGEERGETTTDRKKGLPRRIHFCEGKGAPSNSGGTSKETFFPKEKEKNPFFVGNMGTGRVCPGKKEGGERMGKKKSLEVQSRVADDKGFRKGGGQKKKKKFHGIRNTIMVWEKNLVKGKESSALGGGEKLFVERKKGGQLVFVL